MAGSALAIEGVMPNPLCYASVILSLAVVVGESLSFSNLQIKWKGGCDRIRTRDERRPIVTL